MENKKIIIWAGLILLLIFGLIKGPGLLKSSNEKDYNIKSFGIVQEFEIIEGISQSEVGNQVSISAFQLKYSYQYENKNYESEAYINNSFSLSFDQKNKLKNLKIGDSITIKINSNSPDKSIVDLN